MVLASHSKKIKFIPAKLKTKRESLGLTHLDLAFQVTFNGIRITPQTLVNWETGKTIPNPRLLRIVAETLKCKVKELYG